MKRLYQLMLFFIPTLLFSECCLTNIRQLTTAEMGFEKAGEAYFSPDSQMIIFQAVPHGENDYHIYTLDLKNHNLQKVSGKFEACTCAFFRPDGNKIIFAASPLKSRQTVQSKYSWDFTPYMNIYEANVDGSELTPLTTGPAYHAECAYSHDGKSIVFASNESGSMNLYIMDSTGENVEQLTHSKECYNGGPFFSPDDTKILFRADPDKKDYLQIYTIDIDTANLAQHTFNENVNWAPFWFPSGEGFAYTTSIHGHHRYEIYFHCLKTGNDYRVTNHKGFDGLPTFNREGNKMLFTSQRGLEKKSQVFIGDFNL